MYRDFLVFTFFIAMVSTVPLQAGFFNDKGVTSQKEAQEIFRCLPVDLKNEVDLFVNWVDPRALKEDEELLLELNYWNQDGITVSYSNPKFQPLSFERSLSIVTDKNSQKEIVNITVEPTAYAFSPDLSKIAFCFPDKPDCDQGVYVVDLRSAQIIRTKFFRTTSEKIYPEFPYSDLQCLLQAAPSNSGDVAYIKIASRKDSQQIWNYDYRNPRQLTNPFSNSEQKYTLVIHFQKKRIEIILPHSPHEELKIYSLCFNATGTMVGVRTNFYRMICNCEKHRFQYYRLDSANVWDHRVPWDVAFREKMISMYGGKW